MEAIYMGLMQTMQAAAERRSTTAADESTGDGAGFRELMKKNQGAEKASQTEDSVSAEGRPADAVTAEQPTEGEDVVSQEQLLSAALATMQNPVVVAAEDTAPDAPLTQLAPQTVQAVQTAQTAQETAEVAPVEQNADAEATAKQEANTAVEQRPVAEEAPQTTERTTVAHRERTEAAAQTDRPEQDLDKTEEVRESGTESAVFKDTKSVLVKVGEAASAEQSVPVKEQVGEQILRAIDQGKAQVSVQLTPESLGTIEVRMTVTDDGRLLVALHAENRQTQQLLEKDLGGLQQILSRGTQQEVQIEVPRQHDDRQQSFEDGGQHRQQEQHQEQREQKNETDFLHRLRLGLIPLDAEAS